MADAQPQDEGVSVTAQAPTIDARVSIPSPVVIVAAGEVSSAPTDTTSLGIPATRTVTIKQSQVIEGFHYFELIENGNLLWSGMGDDPVEGLLKIIIRMTEGEDPDHPNN